MEESRQTCRVCQRILLACECLPVAEKAITILPEIDEKEWNPMDPFGCTTGYHVLVPVDIWEEKGHPKYAWDKKATKRQVYESVRFTSLEDAQAYKRLLEGPAVFEGKVMRKPER